MHLPSPSPTQLHGRRVHGPVALSVRLPSLSTTQPRVRHASLMRVLFSLPLAQRCVRHVELSVHLLSLSTTQPRVRRHAYVMRVLLSPPLAPPCVAHASMQLLPHFEPQLLSQSRGLPGSEGMFFFGNEVVAARGTGRCWAEIVSASPGPTR